MAARFLVVQHTSWEKPGNALVRAAEAHDVKLTVVPVWRRRLPRLDRYHGVVVLGGSPNVDEEEVYPFLRPEKEFLALVLARDLPCFGICLGMQLLAHVLGARVGPVVQPRAGFYEVFRTAEGRNHPAFRELPDRVPVFAWHGQGVQGVLPKEFVVLATSNECEVDAFTLAGRPHVLGVQFDNHGAAPKEVEVFLARARNWFAAMGNTPPAAVRADAKAQAARISGQFRLFFAGFLVASGLG